MQNHQHIIVRSVDKTKARAWTNKSEDSPSSQSSFWKDNVDGSDPSIHSAKYDIMCESSTGDHACHLVELEVKAWTYWRKLSIRSTPSMNSCVIHQAIARAME
ncbi:hypothetical protein M747DRAFT_309238 [Aspergillus niger ATCC 13496]|uniref:Uncharacterized protein n=1 Tax=Aspergillus niger ATCC 13496 TaxID=1353008 RepID=A0A370BL35_ASPNG|nr:hypothetical protein M747DRAFT_309238 [Aspergillus niger ATCC 13496]